MSKLPEDLKNFRPAKKVLTKLQKFGENLDLRIRPHVLLKVLQDLRIWELCSPDIAVAIEVITIAPFLPVPQLPSFRHLPTSRHCLSAVNPAILKYRDPAVRELCSVWLERENVMHTWWLSFSFQGQ